MKSQQPRKKASCFLVSSEGRDFFLLMPVIYYLETFENYDVSFEFVWDAHQMRKNPPDLVLFPNTRGNHFYYEIAKYCNESGILIYSHDSEGNFSTEIDYDYWAFNLAKKSLCPVHYTWNERVKKFLMDKYDLPSEEFVVTGAPGFDKYQYMPQREKVEVLKKYGLDHYKTVVGYAGWAFGKLENKEIGDVLSNIDQPGEAGMKWMAEQRDKVEKILKTLIEANPDILFVLKKHPRENFESDLRDSRNEMNRLKDYDNVFYLKDEEDIQDLIQISDLWMAFESSSIIEAWLLGKPTMMTTPDGNFKRATLHKGSINAKSPEEAMLGLEALKRNEIEYFNSPEVVAKRSEIISSSIGFADGFNHLRVVKSFMPLLENHKKAKQKPKLNWRYMRLYFLLHWGKPFFVKSIFQRLPKFKKVVWIFENHKLEGVKKNKPVVTKHLDKFYADRGLNTKIKSGEIWKEL